LPLLAHAKRGNLNRKRGGFFWRFYRREKKEFYLGKREMPYYEIE
jgi:hypothetical protein